MKLANIEEGAYMGRLPQLIVFSAVTNAPDSTYPNIANFCAMVNAQEELYAKIEKWQAELQENGYKIVNQTLTLVPRSVYEGET